MITLPSFAKINWYLRVLEKRPDGYHDIETLFQEISLADELTFAISGHGECEIVGMPFDVPPGKNLIHWAWALLSREFPGKVGGCTVQINKRIPAGGGLGGGSSNAATTLKGLNTLFSLGLTVQELEELGAVLGSDVPFFIQGGCAIGTGRGETLTRIDLHPGIDLALFFPNVAVSTAEAYARLDELIRVPPTHSIDDLIHALQSKDTERVALCIHNDFELPLAGSEWFRSACLKLTNIGCVRAFLSGSGSTVIGMQKNLAHGNFDAPSCATNYPSWVVLSTCNAPSR
jgi:4-diphosphocytidyl-2-C-methyl-D-erythritol kinase